MDQIQRIGIQIEVAEYFLIYHQITNLPNLRQVVQEISKHPNLKSSSKI